MTRPIGSRHIVLIMLTGALLTTGCGGSRSTTTDVAADDLAAQARAFADRAGTEGDAPNDADVEWLSPSTKPRTVDPRTIQRPRPAPTAHTAPPVRPQPTDVPVNHTPTAQAAPPVEPQPLTQAELVRRLSKELTERASATDESLRPWLARAALAAIDPMQELKVADLSSLSPDNRKVVLAYQRTFSELAKSLKGGADQDRQVLLNLADELQGELAGDKSLRITAAKLCKKVNGYGVYEPFEKHAFLAGRKQPVIVYLELDNFATRATGERYLVELTQEVVLYNDADGLPVWRQKPVTIRDESRNRRRDFFVVQVVHLSPRLTVGKYDMKVMVTDEVGMKVNETTIPIEIVADPALAAKQ